MEKLKSEIKLFEKKVKQLEYNLENRVDFIYDECSELKRKVQLDHELKLADLKKSKGLDVNAELELNKLDKETIDRIEELQTDLDTLIAKIDKYQTYQNEKTNLAKPSEKALGEIKLLKQFTFKNYDSLKNMKKLSKKLNENLMRLQNANKLVRRFLLNNNELEFINEENQLNCLYFKKTIDFKALHRTKVKFQQIFTAHFHALNDGRLLIVEHIKVRNQFFKSVFSIYNSTGKNLEKSLTTEFFVFNLKIVANKIVLVCSNENSRFILIKGLPDLNTVCRKMIGNLKLICANQSTVYFQEDLTCSVKLFDWSLRELPTDLVLNNLPQTFFKQIEIFKENYLIRFYNQTVVIYNKMGVLKETIMIESNDTCLQTYNDSFVVFCSEDKSLKNYDFNGKLLKKIQIETPSNVDDLKFRLNNNNGKFYFYFDQENSFIYFQK